MFNPEIIELTQEEQELLLLEAIGQDIPNLDDLFFQAVEGYGDE